MAMLAPQVITSRKSFTKEDFRNRAWGDHEYFCRELLPESFYMAFGQVHHDIMSLMYSHDQFVGVVAPRKIGKTPTICFSYPLKQILYNAESYIVIVSATIGEAERHVKKIVNTLEMNRRIHYYFGELIDTKRFEVKQGSAQFTNRIWLRSKGLGSQIRGTGGDWTPPSLIIVDDPQSNKDVKTDTSLANAVNWFDDEVIYSIAKKWLHPRFGVLNPGKVRFLGTSLHPQCLAERVLDDPRFTTVRYGMLMNDDGEPDIVNGKSIWESMFPTDELYAEMKAAEEAGRLGNWLQERMNMPYKYGHRIFKQEDNRFWDLGNNRFDTVNGVPVLILDEDIGIATTEDDVVKIGRDAMKDLMSDRRLENHASS